MVNIPASATNSEGANPTGIVFNSGPGFVVSNGTTSGPSVFIFVGEDGSISGWSPTVDSTNAIIAVDDGEEGSVYKGAALGESSSGLRLFVTNFSAGEVSITLPRSKTRTRSSIRVFRRRFRPSGSRTSTDSST